ncbi:hypothetical protein [Paenibacillus cucumis (ex Kampfer et al. 2016)]|uniref:Pectate lyase superfamily protein domain-containing protein n=1 Tax=Paenibacillus cucumis (ex Kampfer et al. 2016) TaxID=1776858 RepID=A0ABS7KM79_9BACL|nr:hypothetical protein [Paenibacillus cucumis (ex Kampfer et al. 2016)]MBY0205252.1 hypothetical protein [Paenibacillus cucumis (ex Kampfer et al. 2016)]
MPTVSELMSQNNTNAMMNYRLWGELVYVVTAYDIFPDGTDVTNKLQALVNLANIQGRTAIFFPAGEYFVTYINNDENIYLFGDNATFVGGYTKAISQIGDAGTDSELREILFDSEPVPQSVEILDYRPLASTQHNSFSITKDNFSAAGGTQKSALLVRNSISASVKNEEVGIFSVLNVFGNSQHHVGMYSQVNGFGADTSFLYGQCIEIKNTQPDGSGTTSNQALVGLEIDLVNKYEYDGTDDPLTRKTGMSVVAWGGATNHEAIGIYSAGYKNGDGSYQSGDWLYGLIMRTGSIDNTQGTGILIQSDHSVGIRITGKSQVYGIDLESSSLQPGSVGININPNYSIAMSVPPDKFIKLNNAGGAEGIFYDSVAGAVTISSGKLSLLNHTAATTATAGTSGATPSQVAGYIKCFIGGAERRIPFYNV